MSFHHKDKIVMRGCAIAMVFLLAVLIWGRPS